MKRNRILSVIAIGILLLGFIPAATAGGNVTNRPIEDWAVNNWGIGGWATGPSADEYRVAYPDWWYGLGYEYSGHIIEKRLKDGSFLFTVSLNVKDIAVWIFDETDLLLFGYANFKYQFVFSLDAIIPGNGLVLTRAGLIWLDPDTPRTSVEIIPWWVTIFFFGNVFGSQVISTHGVLAGKGECTGAGGYEAGPATFIVNQRGLFFNREHPQTDPEDPFWGFWPVESIEIHQN